MSVRNVAIFALLSLVAVASADIDYTVTITDGPRMAVSVTIPVRGGETQVQSPNWGPGSYGYGDYWKNVQDVKAMGDGKELTATKPNDYTWSIPSSGIK